MNPKEALVFFLPMILVSGAFIIGFFVLIVSGRSKENKAHYEHGKTNRCHDGAKYRLREGVQNR